MEQATALASCPGADLIVQKLVRCKANYILGPKSCVLRRTERALQKIEELRVQVSELNMEFTMVYILLEQQSEAYSIQAEWPGYQKAVSTVSRWDRVRALFSTCAKQTAELVSRVAQTEVKNNKGIGPVVARIMQDESLKKQMQMLQHIPSVNIVTAAILLQHYRTIAGISSRSLSELERGGVSRSAATQLYRFWRSPMRNTGSTSAARMLKAFRR